MQSRAPWFATSALLALVAVALPMPSYAQPYGPDVEILTPGPNGVLWLDRGDISRAYLDRLQRRQKLVRMRAEHHPFDRAKPHGFARPPSRRYAQAQARRYAQDMLRPPDEIRLTDTPRNDPPPPARDETRDKLRDDVQRLSSDLAKLRSDTGTLREQVGKLTTEAAGLRGEIGALREELAKRANESVVTGKLSEPPRPSEPLRKQDSLKGGADEKFAERPPANVEGVRKADERFSDIIARAWRRVREMVGRPAQ